MKNRNDELVELDIESIGFNGVAVARKEGLVYFVKGAVPGDKVIAVTKKKKRNYIDANINEILIPSNDRITAVCEYFGVCGGCTWQNLKYEEQLRWKRQHIIDAFERLAKVDVEKYEDTVPSVSQFHYRNKMEFSFGTSRWLTNDEILNSEDIQQKDFALGLHVPGRYDKVLDIFKCHIQHDIGNNIINSLRSKALELNTSAFDSVNHHGFLKNVIIRTTNAYNEILVLLITNDIKTDEDKKMIDWYRTEFVENFPEITVLAHVINNTFSPVSYGETEIIKGPGYIREKIMGIEYHISPYSFFQTNSAQLDIFIGKIIEKSELNQSDLVWDLYCGTGSITLPISKHCAGVIGIEMFEGSVTDARKNAELNSIKNVQFMCSDLHAKNIGDLLNNLPDPDVVILDPPRAGMHINLVNNLRILKPKKIIYVSCNPATQARDVELLKDLYKIQSVTAVDMFPQTFHVEAIAVMKLIE